MASWRVKGLGRCCRLAGLSTRAQQRAVDGLIQAAVRLDDGELVRRLAIVRNMGAQLLNERARYREEWSCCLRTIALLSLVGNTQPTDPRWPLRLLEQQRVEWGLPPMGA